MSELSDFSSKELLNELYSRNLIVEFTSQERQDVNSQINHTANINQLRQAVSAASTGIMAAAGNNVMHKMIHRDGKVRTAIYVVRMPK